MNYLKHVNKAYLLVGLAIFLAPGMAKALTVSPPLVDESMDPGQSRQGRIMLINDTNDEQTYYTSIQKFMAKGEEGQQEYLDEKDAAGLPKWLTLDQDKVTLKPGESKEFGWLIRLPQNAEPGGHYASVFFSTQPSTDGQTTVGVGGKLGVLFLVNVSGNIKEDASVESFALVSREQDPAQAKPISSLNHLPALFELRVKNTGSVHIEPQGELEIRNLFGGKVAAVPANPQRSRVLPDSIRRIRTIWGDKEIVPAKGFWDGLKNEWKGFAVGRYTAELKATYGKQQQPLAASVSFWVLPWRLCLVGLLILVLLLLFIKGYNKMVIKSAMSKAEKKQG
jgi:hypothetical protein